MKNSVLVFCLGLFSALLPAPGFAEPLSHCAQNVKVFDVKDLGNGQFSAKLETTGEDESFLNTEVFGEEISAVLMIDAGTLEGTYLNTAGKTRNEQPIKGVDLVNLLSQISKENKLLDLSCSVGPSGTGEFVLTEFQVNTVEDPAVTAFNEELKKHD